MAQGGLKQLVVITDAWKPQTNGVVTTLSRVMEHMEGRGITTRVIHPGLFRTLAMPGYREIPLAWNVWAFDRVMAARDADFYHVATEGPLGLLARRWLRCRGLAYTTSLHTRFPEYVNARLPWLPVSLGYRFLRWFHGPARRTLVTTPSLQRELAARGFDHLLVWGRGVDTDTFAPLENRQQGHPGPLMVYVGRVAVEKNLQAFLSLRLPGTKMVVGDGPALAQLRSAYPEALFTGYRYGAALAELYGRADVFVFPSRTDTFGLVMLEAMACGTPVAAYPVTGPIDIIREGENGALDEDLAQAIRRALAVPRESCRRHALRHSWSHCADTFADSLAPARREELELSRP